MNENPPSKEIKKSVEREKLAEMKVGDCLLADADFFRQALDRRMREALESVAAGGEPRDSDGYSDDSALAVYHYGGIELFIQEGPHNHAKEETVSIIANALRDYWPMFDGKIFQKGDTLPNKSPVSRPWVYKWAPFKLYLPKDAVVARTDTEGAKFIEEFDEEQKARRRRREEEWKKSGF
ncbi:MAG: hypothetical protein WC030_02485 [Candidatus Paceibacterota bacterium]